MNYKDLQRVVLQQKNKATNVECPTELACDVKDILSMSAQATLTDSFRQDDEIRYKGRVIFNVIYLLEGEIRRKELGVEFLESCTCPFEPNAKIEVELDCEGISANKTQKLTLQTIVTAKITAYNEKITPVFGTGENLCVNTKKIEKTDLCGDLSGNFTIDDQVEYGFTLKNVLSSSSRASVTGCQCGMGCVIIDGEIILSLALLPFDENSDIIKETRTIPFRLELEGERVDLTDIAFANATVLKTGVKVFVDEGQGKTTLESQTEICLTAKAYKKQEFDYVDDLFCVNRQLSIAKENFDLEVFEKQKFHTQKVNGKAFCTPPENSRLVCVMEERVYGVSYRFGDGLTVEGVLSAHVLFENLQNKALSSVMAEIPFSFNIDENQTVDNLKCVCRSTNARLRSDEVEMDGELALTYQVKSQKQISVVTQVTEGEGKQSVSAFSVYIPSKTDTLWEVAKALSTPQEIISEQNPNLNFPITDNQRIVVYNKLVK